MAGRKTYKDMTLAELEQKVADRAAAGQRVPAALKEAVEAARKAAQQDTAAETAEQSEIDDSGYHEACELDSDEVAALANAEGETEAQDAGTRRTEFTVRAAQLMDAGFSESQAVEALTSEFPAEAAEYTAMAATRPPKRDLRDVDLSTGEIRVDRKTDSEDNPQQPAADNASAGRTTQPYATISVDPRPITYYWAQLTVITPNPDGDGDSTETITCQCVYGHEREDLAIKHAKKLAAERGLRVA